jgi:hypothetical protein
MSTAAAVSETTFLSSSSDVGISINMSLLSLAIKVSVKQIPIVRLQFGRVEDMEMTGIV